MLMNRPNLFLSATDMKMLKNVVTTEFNYMGYYLDYPHPVEYVEIRYEGVHIESTTITLTIKYLGINDVKTIDIEGISCNDFDGVCEKLRQYLQFKDYKGEAENRYVKITNNQEKLMIECDDYNGSERTAETMIFTKVMTKEFKATLIQKRPITEANNGEEKK